MLKFKSLYLSFFLCLVFANTNLRAQLLLPHYPDSLFSTYYLQRVSLFKILPNTKDDIIFLGNSITDGSEWSELFNDLKVKNRGISGDNTIGIINRLDEVVNRNPAKVFLMIGVNDLAMNISPDSIIKNILFITGYIHQSTASTQLFIQSILPVNDAFGKFKTHTNKEMQVKIINDSLKINAHKYHFTFIDLYPSFCDKNEKLNPSLTNDGLHLKGEGYLLWKKLIYPYMYGIQEPTR